MSQKYITFKDTPSTHFMCKIYDEQKKKFINKKIPIEFFRNGDYYYLIFNFTPFISKLLYLHGVNESYEITGQAILSIAEYQDFGLEIEKLFEIDKVMSIGDKFIRKESEKNMFDYSEYTYKKYVFGSGIRGGNIYENFKLDEIDLTRETKLSKLLKS